MLGCSGILHGVMGNLYSRALCMASGICNQVSVSHVWHLQSMSSGLGMGNRFLFWSLDIRRRFRFGVCYASRFWSPEHVSRVLSVSLVSSAWELMTVDSKSIGRVIPDLGSGEGGNFL